MCYQTSERPSCTNLCKKPRSSAQKNRLQPGPLAFVSQSRFRKWSNNGSCRKSCESPDARSAITVQATRVGKLLRLEETTQRTNLKIGTVSTTYSARTSCRPEACDHCWRPQPPLAQALNRRKSNSESAAQHTKEESGSRRGGPKQRNSSGKCRGPADAEASGDSSAVAGGGYPKSKPLGNETGHPDQKGNH